MKTYYLVLALLFSVFSFSQEKSNSDVERLVNYMSGKFDSSRQAENYEKYYNIQLIMIPVWEDKDEHWLYVEQAMASKPQEPYRQRFYKISKSDDNTIMSQVYELKAPKKFIGQWKKPSFFDQITTDDITLREGCAIYLTQEAKGFYKGSTKDKACSSSLRGASYATSIVKISPEMLTSWDRGFDDNGNQVWGAEDGAYNFIKKESFK
jgi:hypothetical protein